MTPQPAPRLVEPAGAPGDPGVCARCGRERTRMKSGAPVSCCPRAVQAPVKPRDEESVVAALERRVEAYLLEMPTSALRTAIVPFALLLGVVLLVSAVVRLWHMVR